MSSRIRACVFACKTCLGAVLGPLLKARKKEDPQTKGRKNVGDNIAPQRISLFAAE